MEVVLVHPMVEVAEPDGPDLVGGGDGGSGGLFVVVVVGGRGRRRGVMRVNIGHVMLRVHHHLLLHHGHGGCRVLHSHPLVLVLMRLLRPLLLLLLLTLLLTEIAVGGGLSHE